MEQAVDDIDEALTKINETESTEHPAVALRQKLEEAATALYEQANQHLQKMIKQQPPTMEGVEWLKNHDLIKIKKTVKRRRLKSSFKDYLDEYTLTDKSTKAVLWYAHFHYAEALSPSADYTVAHLKTKAQRRLSYYSQLAEAQNGQAIVNVHRGQIGKALAERWFLPLVS